jgi:hypothetical protein
MDTGNLLGRPEACFSSYPVLTAQAVNKIKLK